MLVQETNMQSYFREALESALGQTQICISDSAQVYLVHLLNEFCRSEVAFAGTSYGERLNMVSMIERALLAEDQEALRIFRHMGDSALYLLGFFKGSQAQRIVSERYYADMGTQGYSMAADLCRAYAASSAAIFQELSEQFSQLVKTFEHMANYSIEANN